MTTDSKIGAPQRVGPVALLFGVEVPCPKCGTKWQADCEQGISVALYGRCIVCAPKNEMHIGEICAERSRRYVAAGFADPYSPNAPSETRRGQRPD